MGESIAVTQAPSRSWRASPGDRLAYLLHRVEGAGGEAVQFIGVDEGEPLVFDGVQHGPLPPVIQHGRILAASQDEPGIGLDHLLQPDLGIGCGRLRHDVVGPAEADGLARPGRIVGAGERRVPELVEDGDGLGLAIARRQGV